MVGAKALAAVLRSNRTLASLGLGNNRIGVRPCAVPPLIAAGSEGCEELAEMLRENRALKKLVLAGNQIDDFGLKALADALAVNKSLATLVALRAPFAAEPCSCWAATALRPRAAST